METRKETIQRRMIAPVCSIVEEDGLVSARLEMPGVAKDGVEIKIEGNELEILGTRGEPSISGTYLLHERRAGTYRKVFTIDDTIARDGIDAKLAEGVLTITFKVKEAAKPRKIEIA